MHVPAAPSSTYRLQIRAGFDLDAAARLLDYLRDLGVGAVYLSPLLRATSGSDHGYDTVDPTQIDPARGGEQGWQRLRAAAAELGLGVVIDIVPNHLGIAVPQENTAWWDVLTHGRESAYANWFDIDWSRGPILVPILSDDADQNDDGLTIVDGELRYLKHRFPLAPGSWSQGEDADTVHARQHYRLASWRLGNSELNYRRFFAVSTLAGVRIEDPQVFTATHPVIRRWATEAVAGLRIDHPDGLANPRQYLERLREIAPEAWVTVEKILEPGEELPTDWPVAGTTGYDAMRQVGGLFLDPSAAEEFTALYVRLTGDEKSLAEHVEDGKRLVTDELLIAELRRLSGLSPEVPEAEPALAELAIAFGVYRSYLPQGAEYLDDALATAAVRRPDLGGALAALGPRLHDPDDELAVRFQQLSGATMAKGVEDTAYYRYARFVALNEVGGNPDQFGIPVAEFHRLQLLRQERLPESMTSLSTHDTKRGEDVRARLAVLTEMPQEWAAFAEEFLSRAEIPDAGFAYLLAQTLVGAGPIDRERMHAYAAKAMHEAARSTSYTDPDEAFEKVVHATVDLGYDETHLRTAWDRIVHRVTAPGWSNSLGQKLLQLALPGVPDVYQGTELWDDSLVDPDNRRPVDFGLRRRMLADLAGSDPPVDVTGAAKLWVTSRTLRLRRDRSELFTGYTPVHASGPAADHLVAFERCGLIAVATRLPLGLAAAGGWRDTVLPVAGTWADVLRLGRLVSGNAPVADLLDRLPVALLVRT